MLLYLPYVLRSTKIIGFMGTCLPIQPGMGPTPQSAAGLAYLDIGWAMPRRKATLLQAADG